MDRILIDDLLLRCIIGVDEDERREKQDVLISLCIYTNLKPAAMSDTLEHAVDYRALKIKIIRLVEESRFHLLEALSESIAAVCLENPLVRRVRVRVDKPHALRFARNVGVEIIRSRGGKE
ncbi:MAG: dihydroneopterin aldolase [Candidatus Latescibacterota bacterium]